MIWDDAKVARLVRLWRQGRTGGQIAAELGGSRGGILGKVHRLGLKRGSGVVTEQQDASRAGGAGKAKSRPAAPVVDAAPVLPTLFEDFPAAHAVDALERSSCRYPLGDPGVAGFRFCCAAVKNGKPYCPEHARVAFHVCPGRLIPASRTGALHGRTA